MSKLKVYLSTSFKADQVLVARVKDRLLEKNVEILTYTGSGWSMKDEEKLKSADILVLVPHDKFANTLHLGAGQYNEIRRFYDAVKTGYKSMAIVYPNSNNIEVNADSALSFTSCIQVPSRFQNMTDNYCCVTGLNTHNLSTFIDINKALIGAKNITFKESTIASPKTSKPSHSQTSDLPQEVIDAIAEAQRGSMMSINSCAGICALGLNMDTPYEEHAYQNRKNPDEYERAINDRAACLSFKAIKQDDFGWKVEVKMAATAISEPIDIDDASAYTDALTPMLALYPIICKG